MPPLTPPNPKSTTPPYHHLHPPPPYIPKPIMKQQPFPNIETGPAQRKEGLLLRPHHRTNPAIWCGAVLCFIFSVLLILAGIVTLVVFLVIKPRTPIFEISAATLNGIYLDSPTYFNGDLTFLANISNPNSKLDLAFVYASVELYYHNRLVSAQGIPAFVQPRLGSRLENVHMVSSEVYLPKELVAQMGREVRSNRVVYDVRGTFKVRASFAVGHLSYWVYGRCLIELTAPPGGVLVARSCRTKK